MTTSTLSGGYAGLVDIEGGIEGGGGRELILMAGGRLLADDGLGVSDELLAGTGGWDTKESDALDEQPRVGLVASDGTGRTLNAPLV